MSAEDNKAIVRRLLEEGLNKGDNKVIEELVASNFKSREDESTRTLGVEGYKEEAGIFHTAFPDGRLTIEEMVAEGDNVVTWMWFTGTHEGPLEGIPPTGRKVKVRDVDLYRLEHGKVVESWAHFDQLGMMKQLGALGAGAEER
jgi:steroid delta-isomerase-like uncharacterized protein